MDEQEGEDDCTNEKFLIPLLALGPESIQNLLTKNMFRSLGVTLQHHIMILLPPQKYL